MQSIITILSINIVIIYYQAFQIQNIRQLRMQLQKVKAAFEKKGFTPNAYIEKREYLRVLDSLVPGGQFHDQVADQLWTQAAGERPSKQLRVSQICSTIVDAQNILKTRINQTSEQINILEGEKRKLQQNATRDSIRRISQIDNRIEQLFGQKQSFEDDFRIVTEPFGIKLLGSTNAGGNPYNQNSSIVSAAPQDMYAQYGRDSMYNSQKFSEQLESQDLKNLFYLTITFGFLEIIMIYGKSDFLNLMVLACLLSIYCMSFFDKIYIRLSLALITASIVLDLVWLIMYAGPKWNPGTVSNTSQYQIGYMRFIVFFTILLIPLKAGVFYLLFKYKNAETKEKFMISVGLLKIMLSANKSNPISKTLASAPILSQ